ncbi:MAG: hypothetical protein OSJ55_07685 [Bacteroidales bacterium]|nr:hypothetical protein [Bacteroidales bacterium]
METNKISLAKMAINATNMTLQEVQDLTQCVAFFSELLEKKERGDCILDKETGYKCQRMQAVIFQMMSRKTMILEKSAKLQTTAIRKEMGQKERFRFPDK